MRKRASAVIIVNNEILLIRRKKAGEEYYVFPGGEIESQEIPEEAVIRELQEEAGIKAETISLLGEMPLPEISQHMYFVLCSVGKKEEIIWQESYKLAAENTYEIVWVDLNQLAHKRVLPEKAIKEIIPKASAYLKRHFFF